VKGALRKLPLSDRKEDGYRLDFIDDPKLLYNRLNMADLLQAERDQG
jgi:hypothetical protein